MIGGRDNVKHTNGMRIGGVLSTFAISTNFFASLCNKT